MIFRSLMIAGLVAVTPACREKVRPNSGFAGGERKISGNDYEWIMATSDRQPTHLVLIPKEIFLSRSCVTFAGGRVAAELTVKDEAGKAAERTYDLNAPISLIHPNLSLTAVKLTAVNRSGSGEGTVNEFYTQPTIEWQLSSPEERSKD